MSLAADSMDDAILIQRLLDPDITRCLSYGDLSGKTQLAKNDLCETWDYIGDKKEAWYVARFAREYDDVNYCWVVFVADAGKERDPVLAPKAFIRPLGSQCSNSTVFRTKEGLLQIHSICQPPKPLLTITEKVLFEDTGFLCEYLQVWNEWFECKIRDFQADFSAQSDAIQETETPLSIKRLKFKRCGDHVLLLYVPSYAWTNEARCNAKVKDFAKFRASLVWTVAIYQRTTESWLLTLDHMFRGQKVVYTVGAFTKPDDVDINPYAICAPGAHYFDTLLPALYYPNKPGPLLPGPFRLVFEDDGTCFGYWNNIPLLVAQTTFLLQRLPKLSLE